MALNPKVEPNLKALGQTITLLQEDMDLDYFDALIETGDNLLTGEIQVENGHPKPATVAKLQDLYDQVDLTALAADDVRLLVQLLILKGYKQEAIQPNHQMTPDTIGLLLANILTVIFRNHHQLSLLDMGVGTGNLLFTLLNHLPDQDVTGMGVDNDDTLLTLASLSGQLQQIKVDLFHQDGLDPLLVPAVDAVVSDLPVGYYPIDEKAQKFATHNQEGHSFAHHLLIEQSLNTLKPGGVGVFIVPAGLFQTPAGLPLVKYIQQVGYLQALLNLPQGLFGNTQARKAILLVQKQGGNAQQASQVLLGDFPEIKNQDEFAKFVHELEAFLVANVVVK